MDELCQSNLRRKPALNSSLKPEKRKFAKVFSKAL